MLLAFAPCLCAFITAGTGDPRACEFTLARLKYEGGGDWYANPSALPNLVAAVKKRTGIAVCDTIATVAVLDEELFRYPLVFMTGHGNVSFSHAERLRLRSYLIGGGMLWADDNYGMDKSFRREIAALFPENPLKEIPHTHGIYTGFYELPGVPKIHEHDGEPAQGLGVFFEDRLVIFYTYSADIGDGMEDLHVHKDGEKLHELALRMGVNVIAWFFNPR
ncbi:MAG: DUF4159 domain-containing protein [Chitinivibrionales bacterium]|nr:DUF4159 domain-containing protein [Chitinivibrionales bacterium]MBD3394398.1 DUF4159 domain-containing protein [Chitinivibrionales bacterium]